MRIPDFRRAAPRAVLTGLLLAGALPLGAAAQQQQPTSGLAGVKLSNSLPIQIESDKLEVHDLESTALFTGNVSVIQGPTLLKAGKMTVFYTKNDKDKPAAPMGSSGIDRMEVADKVYIKSDDQVATGDFGTFDMKTEIFTLSGTQVVLTQGPNVLVGCKVIVQMRTGLANVDGCKKGGAGSARVIMSITPNSQPQANAQN